MKQFYLLISVLTLFIPSFLSAQNCASLTATFATYESRCAATGSIKIAASGGSGAYKYRATGPINLNFTTSDLITGLPAGTYNVEVVDLNTGCQFTSYNVKVGGNYSDPRFVLNTTDVSCLNGNNGEIAVADLQNGRQPFTFTIIAPSAMGVGTSNSTGVFSGLAAGKYTIQLKDSCGGIQTRSAFINDYTWYIEGHTITRNSCNNAAGTIKVKDSRNRYSYSGGGIPNMQYGILRAPGDTIWSSNAAVSFDATGMTTTKVFAKDNCGNVKSVDVDLALNPSVGSTVLVDQKTCSTFRASVQSVKDMFSPSYQIFDKSNELIASNATGIFTNLAYGTYSIVTTDGCTGISITRSVTASAPVVTVDANVKASQWSCNYFTASFTGQTNTTNPAYKIFDENNVVKGSNTSGIFQFLSYGKYRLEMKDGCVDTTIVRYIDVKRPVMRVDSLAPSYIKCNVFGINAKADSIYGTAQYCLYDNSGNQIACNNTGKFDSLALGSYCVTIHDDCTDTTITRCISVAKPVLTNDLVVNIAKYCPSFSAVIKTTNFKGATFSLYTKDSVLISTNSTGSFSGLAYGDYCVKAQMACPDTTVTVCFSGVPIIPTGTGYLSVSNQRCDLFDVEVKGISNLNGVTYTFKNSLGQQVYKGSSARVYDLPYDNYCVEIKNSCYDTTINICKEVTAPVNTVSTTFYRSCTYGFTRLYINASVYPVTVMVKDPSDVMVASEVLSAAGYIEDIPDLPSGQAYTIETLWNCGQKITTTGTPVVGYLDHSASVEQFCPGSVWPDGFGNVTADVSTNTGHLNVRIIKKDDQDVFLFPDNVSGSIYKFINLGPATYILRYYSDDACKSYLYDTVTVKPYQYPGMDNTTAFQCDNTGFSVGAYVNGGVGPFTYEIMSSTPSAPSIVREPQSDPVFNIDNGSIYELIRLRAVDACGNATLGDASILPLASNQIKGTTDNCIGSRVTLSIDTMINSTVSWTFKHKKTDPDETVVGSGFVYEINPLSYSDTGYYYCHVTMNNGCVLRTYEFNLNGECYGVLSDVDANLKGRVQDEKSMLEWTVNTDEDLEGMTVERNNSSGGFEQIGRIDVLNWQKAGEFKFVDEAPLTENQYRIKFMFKGGKYTFSKILHLSIPARGQIKVYPNPAVDFVNVELNMPGNNSWQAELINLSGQKTVLSDNFTGQQYTIRRTSAMTSGMYILKVINRRTGENYNFKVVFKK